MGFQQPIVMESKLGKRGPPPKHPAERKLDGGARKAAKSKEFDYLQPAGVIIPNADLEDYAKEAWDRMVMSMPPGVWSAIDQDLLGAYCTLAALHWEAVRRLKAGTAHYIEENARGGAQVGPWVRIQLDCASKMAQIGMRLGLDPVARLSMRAPQAEDTEGRFGGLIGGVRERSELSSSSRT